MHQIVFALDRIISKRSRTVPNNIIYSCTYDTRQEGIFFGDYTILIVVARSVVCNTVVCMDKAFDVSFYLPVRSNELHLSEAALEVHDDSVILFRKV